MRVLGALGGDSARVVVDHELRQKGVGRFDRGDPSEAQLLDEPILKGLIGPLYSTLGLRAMGMNRLNVEGLEGMRELCQPTIALGRVDAEDTVLVRVEGHRAPMSIQVLLKGLHVGLGCLYGGKT